MKAKPPSDAAKLRNTRRHVCELLRELAVSDAGLAEIGRAMGDFKRTAYRMPVI